MNSNTTIVLVAAAFCMIGFLLGRVTSHPAGHPMPPMVKEMRTMKVIGDGGAVSSDIQVVIKEFEEGDFDGDTSRQYIFGILPCTLWITAFTRLVV